MVIDLEQLIVRCAERYDPEYICDVLEISSEELVRAFAERLLTKAEEFAELENPA